MGTVTKKSRLVRIGWKVAEDSFSSPEEEEWVKKTRLEIWRELIDEFASSVVKKEEVPRTVPQILRLLADKLDSTSRNGKIK